MNSRFLYKYLKFTFGSLHRAEFPTASTIAFISVGNLYTQRYAVREAVNAKTIVCKWLCKETEIWVWVNNQAVVSHKLVIYRRFQAYFVSEKTNTQRCSVTTDLHSQKVTLSEVGAFSLVTPGTIYFFIFLQRLLMELLLTNCIHRNNSPSVQSAAVKRK